MNHCVHTYTVLIALGGWQLQGHPGVVSMYWAFQTPRELCVVMELLRGGDFFFHLLKLAMLPEVTSCGSPADSLCWLCVCVVGWC